MSKGNVLQNIMFLLSAQILKIQKKEEYKGELLNKKGAFMGLLEKINNNAEKICKRNQRYLTRIKEGLKSLESFKIVELRAITKTRLLVDASSPFGWLIDEVGLAWHPILDTPYVPASEIRGAVRAAALIENKLTEDQINYLFGQTTDKFASASLTIFLPALPVSCNGKLLELDVITPMYKDPQEHLASPTPIIFMTVSPNVTFSIIYAIDLDRASKLDTKKRKEGQINNILDNLQESVILALEKLGLGAKTSSDYGRFGVLR